MRVEIRGLADLQRKLVDLPSRSRRGLVRSIDHAAERLADDARSRAPEDTRDLVDHIGSTAPETRGEVVESDVESASDHATFVEFGTSETPMQPHLRPAAEAMEQQIGRLVGPEVRSEVERV